MFQPESAPPTLALRVAASCALLADLARDLGRDKVAVAWSGGKDSTAALHLWRETLGQIGHPARPRVLFLDTGLKFQETLAFRDHLAREWDLDLTIVRPASASLPTPRDKAACCAARKIAPLRAALADLGLAGLITGLRGDEHPSRAGRPAREQRIDPPYLQANPLLDWSELDVWAHILEQGLPYRPLYDAGYRSLGCAPCTAPPEGGERLGRDEGKERVLGQLYGLGYF